MSQQGLAEALGALAEEAGRLTDAPGPRWALATVVVELETALGVGLGPAAGDPLVVLQRRWARLHRVAGSADAAPLRPARVRELTAALRAAAPEPAGRGTGRGPVRRLRASVAGW